MKTRSSSSTNVREYRRLRAVELFEGGMKAVRIAEVLGVTRAAVSQWLKRYREQGIDSLYHKPGLGRRGKLTDVQMNELTEMLLQGAENYGYTGDVRTGSRIRELIEITDGGRNGLPFSPFIPRLPHENTRVCQNHSP